MISVDNYEIYSNRDCVKIPEAKHDSFEGAKFECSYFSYCVGFLKINAWFFLCEMIIVPDQDVLQYPHNQLYQKKQVDGIYIYQ